MAGIEQSQFGLALEISESLTRLREWVNRLSSGLKIETADDDPAGLGIREELRAEFAALRQGANNLSDGISLVQTAEASAGQIQDNLVRMQELATQISTGTYSDEQKQILQNELNQLSDDNARISQETTFNGLVVHQNQSIEVQFGDSQSIVVTTRDLQSVEFDFTRDPVSAAEKLQHSIDELSSYRGDLGATSNRMEQAANVVDTQTENLVQAESRISDLDMAGGIASKTAQDMLTQSAIAVQVHADSFSQVILNLLGPKQISFSA
jgi:flagellin